MKASHDVMERIGELADAIDNASRKARIYDDATRRVAYLSGALDGARDQLRRLFIELAKDDPWRDARDITGEPPSKETA